MQLKCAVTYIDNITIFSPSMEQHIVDVEAVLERLNNVNLKINIKKCRFAMNQVKVLGHLVSSEGILPDPKKVEVIQNFQPPTNVTGVKRFLGVVNFFRRFIPNCSTIAEPLIKLTRGRNKTGSIV